MSDLMKVTDTKYECICHLRVDSTWQDNGAEASEANASLKKEEDNSFKKQDYFFGHSKNTC